MFHRIRQALFAAATASALGLALAAPGAPAATASSGSGGSGGIATGGFSVHGETATFALRPGMTTGGRRFWYVAIEASDSNAADRFGVRVVNKLRNAAGTRGVDHGRIVDGVLITHGSVDFAPVRTVVGTPGTGFPPVTARPGSRGDTAYSPLVQLPDGSVLNAPVVANATGVHDKVVSMDRSARTVTLRLTHGFARGNAVRYLSTDATAEGPAALEGATFAPRLVNAPSAGDDSTDSARAGLVAFVNGPTGARNPQRQGLNSALLGEGDPLNVLAWLPGQGRYSSLWDVHLTAWAPGVTPRRERRFADVEDLAEAGRVTAADGSRWAADNIIVNCPILALG
jgi:hypothetical protein